MTDFENVLTNYEPMISASLRQLNIYKEHGRYRQAARIALWQAWSKYDEQKGHFAPYASRSIRGAMLDLLRRERNVQAHYVQTDDNILALLIDREVERIAEDSLSSPLGQAIDSLSKKEKELIQWFYIEQLTQAECAKKAGISVAGIKKRRERMLEKLRRLLGEKRECK